MYTTDELSQEPLCNKVIDDGLVIYEKCNNGHMKMKIGNGINVWSELEYIGKESEINDEVISYETTYSSNKIEDLSNNNIISLDNNYKNILTTIQLENLPISYENSSSVIYNDELHILGGDGVIEYEDIYYTYDFTTSECSKYKNLPCYYASKFFEYNDEIHVFGLDKTTDEYTHYKLNNEEWITVSLLPYDNDDMSIIIYNDEIHILGGYDSSYRKAHYKWNGSEWIEVSTLPHDFYNGSAVVYNNEIYIIGGTSSTNKSFYKYNEGTLEWTSVSELPYEFSRNGAIVYNNEIHILGDADSDVAHYKWNGSEWITLNDLPDDYGSDSSCYIRNDALEIKTEYDYSYTYDDKNDQWIENEDLYFGTYDPLLLHDDKMFIMLTGSNEFYEFLRSHYKWNGSEWIEVSKLPYDFYNGCAVVYNNEIHILGTYNYEFCTSHYKFDTTTSTWISVSILPYPVSKASTLVFNDELYVLGGYGDTKACYKWNGEQWSDNIKLSFDYYNDSCLLFEYNNHLNVITGDMLWFELNDENEWIIINSVNISGYLLSIIIINNELNVFSVDSQTYQLKHLKFNTNDNTSELISTIYGEWYSFLGIVYYNNDIYLLQDLDMYKYKTYYKMSAFAKKDFKLYIQNAFAISDNLEVTDYGFKVIKDGLFEIGIIDDQTHDINSVLNSIYQTLIDDSSKSSYTTYSSTKIENLINSSTVKINDDSSSTNTVYSSDKINTLLNDVNAEINVVVEEKLPIGIKNLNITSNNIDGLTWCDEYPSLPYNFQNGCAVVYNDEIHILGGYSSSCYTAHYKFDGVSWKKVSTLPYDFYNGLAVVYNNEIHILGGNSKNHYKFDATNSTWISVSTLPYSMREGTVIIYNNEIHMLGGSYSSDSMTGHYKFDTTTSTWVSVSTLPISLTDGCSVVYNNEIHILQGSSSTKYHYKFDTTTSTWVSVSTLPYYYFYDGCAVVYNNEIHILGSSRSSYNKYHYKFNGETWNVVANTTSSLPYSFYDGCAVVWKEHLFILGSGHSSYYNKYCSYGRNITDSSNYELSNIKLNNGVTINTKVIDDDDMSEKTTFSSKKINNMLPIAIFENNLKLKVNSINIDSNSLKYNWEQISTLPVNFVHGSAFVLNNELHYIGGTIYNSKRHFKFDNLISNWIELESSPINMYSGGKAIVYNNEIHVFGNNTSHYKFDITTSTWISVSTLPYKFSNGNPIIYNNELHIIGTYSAEATQKEHYKFNNDTSEWTSVSTLPFSSGLAKVVVYNNEIHILGANPSGGSSSYYSHYKFNGEEWIQVSVLPYSFNTSSAIVYNDKIHYMGGSDSNGTKHYTFDYENEWIEADEPLPYNFYNGDLIVYNNEIHILGSGESTSSLLHYRLAIDLSDLSNAVIKSINLEDNKTIPIKQEPTVLYVDEDDRLYIDSELTTSITASELFSLYTKGCLVYLSNYEKYFKPISFSPYGYLDIYTSEGIKSLYTSDAEF